MVENVLLSLLPTLKVSCKKVSKKIMSLNLIDFANDPSQQGISKFSL
jgi:hypothetical protein